MELEKRGSYQCVQPVDAASSVLRRPVESATHPSRSGFVEQCLLCSAVIRSAEFNAEELLNIVATSQI